VKNPAVVVLALLALGVALFLATRRKEVSGRKFASTDEFIQFMAAEAVKDAGGKERIDLDYSVNSIKEVEEILGRLHEQYAKNPSSVSAKGLPVRNRARQKRGLTGRNAPLLINYLLQHHT
jgi:hypothetical protein